MSNIEIRNLNKYYGDKQVLHNINWDIDYDNAGIISLMGENGAGKSTLLKILSGILKHNSGEIFVKECSRDYEKWAKENIAYIQAGERGLRLKNTVYDNVLYYGLLKGKNIRCVSDNIRKYSDYLDIKKLLDKRCELLSMGEKKKAQILCGLCCFGKLLILDEPSTGLDIRTIRELQEILRMIHEEQNICTIVASHDIYFLKDLSDSYVFLKQGKIKKIIDHKLSEKEIEKNALIL